jgi:protein subunit release factor B
MKAPFSTFAIPRDKLEIRSSRSGGSGGQHVNKVETKIDIRFNLLTCEWIPEAVKVRMTQAFATRINKQGELVVTSEATRSQVQNLEDCIKKLYQMIGSCWNAPKKRIKSKPTKGSKERRLKGKKLHADKKKSRSNKAYD